MGILEKQPEGVQFTNRDGKVTISNLNLNLDDNNDENSNASDESLIMTKNTKRSLIEKEKTMTLQPMKSKMIIFSFYSNTTTHF